MAENQPVWLKLLAGGFFEILTAYIDERLRWYINPLLRQSQSIVLFIKWTLTKYYYKVKARDHVDVISPSRGLHFIHVLK